jgi:hypothetical protein
MRTRQIKPGICSNEDLAELGPYSYILFTGLWMLADCTGRFEYRPKHIKALVMPLWDEVTIPVLENLLSQLCDRGMTRKYAYGSRIYMEIVNWQVHQRPDTREMRSKIPPPPRESKPVVPATSEGSTVITRNYGELRGKVPENWELDIRREGGGETSSYIGPAADAPPPPTQPKNQQRKQPECAQAATPKAADSDKSSEADAETFALVRESLRMLARELRMRPPDDALVRQVLAVARGAPGDQIHATLVELFKSDKFRQMHSWGFVPHVLRECFEAA